ncbi:MAG: DUF4331 domain-containing protein [bacterium]|nr:DUF4331 domain-containing protein [bacterium]
MKKNNTKQLLNAGLVALVVAFISFMALQPIALYASSHREAPLISGDPKADGTDLYAFVSPDKPDTVTLIANYLPFQNPAGGPNFYTFDDNVNYDINIDNDADAVVDIVYRYKFKTTQKSPDTFLYNTGPVESLDDPDLNVSQTYTLTKIVEGKATVVGSNIPTPPSNVGDKSTPNYDRLQQAAVKDFANIKTFAGQSDDPFFADLGGLFDLLSIRKLPGNAGGGVDGLRGFSVQSLALQVPIAEVTVNKKRPADAKDASGIVGVWTTASRPTTTVLSSGNSKSSGAPVQVSRLGAPLVNEVVVPLGAKDLWNGSKPADDAQFANGVTDPELGKLLKGLYKINVPPQGKFGTPNARDDLVAIFLTGIPDLTKPAKVVPSEQLRINLAIPPTQSPNRLGVLAKDNQGYPNGRRLADDVTDISLQAVAGAAYPLFHPDFTADATGVQLGDGVDKNDKEFRGAFPYLALPDSGLASTLTRGGQASGEDDDGGGDNKVSSGALVGVGAGALLIGGLAGATLLKRRSV